MGVVVRQSIITSIISYIGVAIGYLNLFYLYPKYLGTDQVGLLRAIQDGAMLLTPFASFGLVQCIIRFYPHFSKNEEGAKSFISLIVLLALMGFGILNLFFFIFQSSVISFFSAKAPEVNQHIGLVLWLTFTLLYTTLFEQYSRSQLKIAVPALLREVGIRIVQALLVSFYFLKWIDFEQFLFLSVMGYVLMLITLIFYLISLGTLTLTFRVDKIKKEKLKEIIAFGSISFIGMSSMVLIAKMDSIMVTGFLGLEANAIYTTAYYMATVIEIPKRAITQSAMPLLAQSFDNNNFEGVKRIYIKSSINQLIIGALLLIGVWANLNNIFALMPNGEVYKSGMMVVMIVGTAKLLDMAFGPSSEIIGLSKYYWFNLVVISFLSVLIVVTNYLLIPRYGITGAAYGSLVALTVYNSAKFIFIKVKLNIQPFIGNTLKVVLIAGATIILNQSLPVFSNVLFDLLFRSAIITIFYSAMILIGRCSEDANLLFAKGLTLIGWRSKS